MSRFSVIGRLYVCFFGRQTNTAAPNGISLKVFFKFSSLKRQLPENEPRKAYFMLSPPVSFQGAADPWRDAALQEGGCHPPSCFEARFI